MKCHNCENKYYTGEENTPLGKGHSAHGEKVGTEKRGRDKKMYVVKEYKNGKRWVKKVTKKKVNARGLFFNPKKTRGVDKRAARGISQAIGGLVSGDRKESVIKTYPMDKYVGGDDRYLHEDLFDKKSKERLKRMGRPSFQQQYDQNMITIMNELDLDDDDIWKMDLKEYDAINKLALENSPGEVESKATQLKLMMFNEGVSKWKDFAPKEWDYNENNWIFTEDDSNIYKANVIDSVNLSD
jgi:hypothetical protein